MILTEREADNHLCWTGLLRSVEFTSVAEDEKDIEEVIDEILTCIHDPDPRDQSKEVVSLAPLTWILHHQSWTRMWDTRIWWRTSWSRTTLQKRTGNKYLIPKSKKFSCLPCPSQSQTLEWSWDIDPGNIHEPRPELWLRQSREASSWWSGVLTIPSTKLYWSRKESADCWSDCIWVTDNRRLERVGWVNREWWQITNQSIVQVKLVSYMQFIQPNNQHVQRTEQKLTLLF